MEEIVLDTMHNIHPIYHIKTLMVMRELARDEKLKNESWDRFLPKFPKRNVKSKKPSKKKKAKKEYTPFPPPQPESKLDKQIASGEYFLTEEQKKRKKMEEKRMKGLGRARERHEKKMQKFVPPQETDAPKEQPRRDVDVKALKARVKKAQKKKND